MKGHKLTEDERRAVVALVKRTRREQGRPAVPTDAAALRVVSDVLLRSVAGGAA